MTEAIACKTVVNVKSSGVELNIVKRREIQEAGSHEQQLTEDYLTENLNSCRTHYEEQMKQLESQWKEALHKHDCLNTKYLTEKSMAKQMINRLYERLTSLRLTPSVYCNAVT